jgi:hypothetical protein
MCDWSEFDTSKISETDFPIRCDRCDCDLTGLGESGRCPQCELRFVRRERLWKTYGPEAFAEPAIRPDEDNVAPADRTFVFGLLWALVLVLSLPVVVLAWLAFFGTIDLCFCILAWLVVALSLEWILLRRRQERKSDSGEENDAGD